MITRWLNSSDESGICFGSNRRVRMGGGKRAVSAETREAPIPGIHRQLQQRCSAAFYGSGEE